MKIRQAENIVWEMPDSALTLLTKIDTLQLNSRQQAYYSLVRIQALNKAGYDISREECIFELKKYYANGKDATKATKAAFYAGRVYQLCGDNKNAAQCYLDALRYEEKNGDRQLNGLAHINMGMLHYEQRHYNEAIRELRESLPFFASNTYYISLALKKIGNAYAVLQQADSARVYYEKALIPARQADNPAILSEILQDMGILFEESGDYPQARDYYRKAISLIGERDRPIPYLNLGWSYFQTGQWDSAGLYARQAFHLLQDEGDSYTLVGAYELLYSVGKAKKNYQDALAWHEQYADSLYIVQEKKNDMAIVEIKKQYETESLVDKIRQKNLAIALILLATLLIVAIVYMIMYKKNIRKNQKIEELNHKMITLEEMAESIQGLEQKATLVQELERKLATVPGLEERANLVQELEQRIEIYNKERNTYRNIALLYFNVLKKGALITNTLDNEEKKSPNILKKFNKIVYESDEFDWNKLFLSLNTLEDGFLEKARAFFRNFQSLDDTDFRVWCLSYAGFRHDEIVLLLKLYLRNVQRRITKIREVFGIGKRKDIHQFVKDNVIKNRNNIKKPPVIEANILYFKENRQGIDW